MSEELLRAARKHEHAAEHILRRLVERNTDAERDREIALIHLGLAQSKRLAVLIMNTRRPTL